MPRLEPPHSCNVYTPPRLAEAIVSVLNNQPNARWLEPCVGQGAFLQALSKHGVPAQYITGIDLSANQESADQLANVQRDTEFLAWATRTEARFDRIVANPPFISLSKVPSVIQEAARRHSTPNGTPVALGGNCWHAFLCASLRLLQPGGALAFVLPASFEYANYGAALRLQLPTLFARCEVHRSQVPLFDSVGEGSVVVIGRGYRAAPQASLRREYASIDEMLQGIGHGDRMEATSQATRRSAATNSVPLSEVMTIGIGAVTGDADFFLMTEADRLRHGLPVSAMRQVVSKSKQIGSAAICRRDWQSMRDRGERVWLFLPTEASLCDGSVRRYLTRSPEDGGCQRTAYKIRNRDPWYVTPLPSRPHGFLSGMSQFGPTICFNRKFSSSSCLKRLNSAVPSPSYFFFQL